MLDDFTKSDFRHRIVLSYRCLRGDVHLLLDPRSKLSFRIGPLISLGLDHLSYTCSNIEHLIGRLDLGRRLGRLVGDIHHATHSTTHATHASHAAAHATHAAAHATHAAAHAAHAAAHATAHATHHAAAHHAAHDRYDQVADRINPNHVGRIFLVGDLHDFVLDDIRQIQRLENQLQSRTQRNFRNIKRYGIFRSNRLVLETLLIDHNRNSVLVGKLLHHGTQRRVVERRLAFLSQRPENPSLGLVSARQIDRPIALDPPCTQRLPYVGRWIANRWLVNKRNQRLLG